MLSYIRNLFEKPIELRNNFILLQDQANEKNQFLTNEAFSDKWIQAEKEQSWKGKALDFQREWYLSLYGFKSEKDLGNFLSNKQVVLDAGCGLGYKAAMFAELSPSTIVIAMDFSESAFIAKEHYKKLDNLFLK